MTLIPKSISVLTIAINVRTQASISMSRLGQYLRVQKYPYETGSMSWKKDKTQTKIDLFIAKGQKTKQRKKEV